MAIMAAHSPDPQQHLDVKPVFFYIVQDILLRGIPDAPKNLIVNMEALKEKNGNAVLEASADIIEAICCEMVCKCSGGHDAGATTKAIFDILAIYSWEAKVVLGMAAFAVIYGEFWLLSELYATNSLAKSLALLKQLPIVYEHSIWVKPVLDELNNLIKAMIRNVNYIITISEKSPQNISITTANSSNLPLIPMAAYWTMRSIVACASKVASLSGPGVDEHITDISELSSLVMRLHEYTVRFEELRDEEAYIGLVQIFRISPQSNITIIEALINPYNTKDIDHQNALMDCSTKKMVQIDVLRGKHVVLLISGLDVATTEEFEVLKQQYKESRGKVEYQYEVVWIPIVDTSVPYWPGDFEKLRATMPWLALHPTHIKAPAIKYIKNVWQFTKKPVAVTMDAQGKVVCKNSLHMFWIWGNKAFPFSDQIEETLWQKESWKLDLFIYGITDVEIHRWRTEKRFICLYGGEDIKWITEFTNAVRAFANTVNLSHELIYVGKRNSPRAKQVAAIIVEKQLSQCWPGLLKDSGCSFWSRLESILYSKLKHFKASDKYDILMKEAMAILGFDGSDNEWAIFSEGASGMARAKGDMALHCMTNYHAWYNHETCKDSFMTALNTYLLKQHSSKHCYRLMFPEVNWGVPDKMVCFECGRLMEKYIMYRCCDD